MEFILKNRRFHFVAVIFLAFLFYYNTLDNEFAHDDVLVITANQFVQKGTAGIKDILTHDSFYGASGQSSLFAGGRYRPLSLVFFAIEKQFFGNTAGVYHFFNVFYYAILCGFILYFLQKFIFKENAFAALVAALLFLVHPVHTEVVANIKSRDEILSLLFLICTLIYFFWYLSENKIMFLIASSLFYFLSLMSKEHGLVLIVLLPVLLFIQRKAVAKIFQSMLPFITGAVIFLLLRYSVNELGGNKASELLNNPYMFATLAQRTASVLWVYLEYLKLMFWPSQLFCDYGYNMIPLKDFSDVYVWISFIVNGAFFAYGCYCIVKRKITGFFILYYYLNIFILSGFLINIGVPMADRFLFAPGLFFIIAVIIIICELVPVLFDKSTITFIAIALIAVISYNRVYARNEDWNNNTSLYFHDVKYAPDNVRLLAFCGMTLVSQTDSMTDTQQVNLKLREAVEYFQRAYRIYPDFSSMYNNWGVAYYRLNKLDSAEWAWDKLERMNPNSIFISQNKEALATARYNQFYQQFLEARKKNDVKAMLYNLRTAVSYYDKMPQSFIALGQLYQYNNQPDSAVICFKKSLELDPQNKIALQLLNQVRK